MRRLDGCWQRAFDRAMFSGNFSVCMSENNLPRVCFIIPTLNAAAMLPACLRSIRNQDYPAEQIKIIVADGGSTDNSAEIAKAHGAQVLNNPAAALRSPAGGRAS